mmetsp:Transcript_63358/g.125267  ORF Transcript_63358/g.125267 Transcript_63358/m.125267 type:complete len:87 (+) Transcript_63358:1326-1586(+)
MGARQLCAAALLKSLELRDDSLKACLVEVAMDGVVDRPGTGQGKSIAKELLEAFPEVHVHVGLHWAQGKAICFEPSLQRTVLKLLF